ncbi:MAG TPA: 50S ribosomal protein L32 [Desulfurobacteriaceae bacterium]|nr:50S ribosomal protein L32 [Desulfurobacteriaceae bacterium]
MAVPKRRVSRTRRDKRRTHWKAKMPTLTVCPNCYEPKRPHRICPYCGYYKDSEAINVKVK